jgi:hypothetical protein
MNEKSTKTPSPKRSSLILRIVVFLLYLPVGIFLFAALILAVIVGIVSTIIEIVMLIIKKILRALNTVIPAIGKYTARTWNFFFGWIFPVCEVCWVPSYDNVIRWGDTGTYSHPLCKMEEIADELDDAILWGRMGGRH